MKRTIAAVVTLAATLTACSADDTEAQPSSRATAKPSPVYGRNDCLARLDRIYVSGAPSDISDGPECTALTPVEYAELVVQVLHDHEDNSLEVSRNVVPWDIAWNRRDVELQDVICELLRTEGIYAVGDQIGGGRADKDNTEMALYLLTNKC
ncbi:hypothetical protein ACFU93_08500 [Streptomyces sp. NPDC057611]|uniref:hypothetical protein n=1 Tax=Streptomyces sp. NPDC057611 TaxID=3346182 RepID=UPI00369DDF3B